MSVRCGVQVTARAAEAESVWGGVDRMEEEVMSIANKNPPVTSGRRNIAKAYSGPAVQKKQ